MHLEFSQQKTLATRQLPYSEWLPLVHHQLVRALFLDMDRQPRRHARKASHEKDGDKHMPRRNSKKQTVQEAEGIFGKATNRTSQIEEHRLHPKIKNRMLERGTLRKQKKTLGNENDSNRSKKNK